MPKPKRLTKEKISSRRLNGLNIAQLLASGLTEIFFNRSFDKSRLKGLVRWTLSSFGQTKTLTLVETLKGVGYCSATEAGLSLGIDDLLIPPSKIPQIVDTETKLEHTQRRVSKGYLTSVEYLSQVITTWNVTNDVIKNQVIAHFKSKDILNPVYMMAFSGARGNISQVRQLVGMRGLMSDPSGRIIDYAIQSNFREGLTLTEYVISCYGARKGVVDTALRTATSGYLTRRLVDVAQHVVIRKNDCKTTRGIYLTSLENEDKVFMTGPSRLTGRVLAEDVYDNVGSKLLAKRNQEVTASLATVLFQHHQKIFVRSALTCQHDRFVCQLCYGWDLSKGRLVTIGETVGIIAAQSIGEPGTQLTMRTFHTGGVFSGEISKTLQAPTYGKVFFLNSIPGKCVRTDQGEVAFLTKQPGYIYINHTDQLEKKRVTKMFLKAYTLLLVKQGENVYPNQTLAELTSLEQLSDKQLSFQTIFSPLSGEVKFRTASVSKGAHNAGYTTFAPLNQSSSEFWVLSAQTHNFTNAINTFVRPGDYVAFKSPVLMYGLIKNYTPVFDCFLFQQYISFYRIQTLFILLAPNHASTENQLSLYATNISSQPTIGLPLFLMQRGTIIERILPFVSFAPKSRLWFYWRLNPGVIQQQQNPNKPFFKSTLKNNAKVKKKPTVFKQKRLFQKRNKNLLGFRFQRLLDFNHHSWKLSLSDDYLFAFQLPIPIEFLNPFGPDFSFSKLFDSSFQPTRLNETKQCFFWISWLPMFETQFFLSSSLLPTDSDLLFDKSFMERFRFKQTQQIIDSKQYPFSPESLSYCPENNLWSIAYLKQPHDFKHSIFNLFPNLLASSLNCILNSTPTNLQIVPHDMFCFYYRLATHFRFHQLYTNLFWKILPLKLVFNPIQFRWRGITRWIKDLDMEDPNYNVRKLPFFPKSPAFLDRMRHNIYVKAYLIKIKQKHEQLQFQPFVQAESSLVGNPTSNLLVAKADLQNQTFLKCPDRQYLYDTSSHFNNLFRFHEFVQVPFCFDTLSKAIKLNQKRGQKSKHDQTYSIKNIVPGFSIFSNTLHRFQIQMLQKHKKIKKNICVSGSFSQTEILLYILTHQTKCKWAVSKQFVNLQFLLIGIFTKIFVWKHIIQKQKKLFTLSSLPEISSNWTHNNQNSCCFEPSKSLYYFLKKQSFKTAKVRGLKSVQIWNNLSIDQTSKRAWFSNTKRCQIASARLNIVYCLTQLLPLFGPEAFGYFNSCLLLATQRPSSEFFEPLFDFYFRGFVQYYKGWNEVSLKQSKALAEQQWLFKQWSQSVLAMWTHKLIFGSKKKKLIYRLKGAKSQVRSFIRLWFYNRQKKRSQKFPIKLSAIPFSAYQSIYLSDQTIFPHEGVFLQKNYENRFLTKFQNLGSKLTNFAMFFLTNGYTKIVDRVLFRFNGFINYSTKSNFIERHLMLNKPTTPSPHMLIYFLKQMKKAWLQNQLGYEQTIKINTITKSKKANQKRKTRTSKSTNNRKPIKIMKPRKLTKAGKTIQTIKTTKTKQNFKTLNPFYLLNAEQKFQVIANFKPGKRITDCLSLFPVCFLLPKPVQFNKSNKLNPCGWISFINSSNQGTTNPNYLQQPVKTGPNRQTFFPFFQKKFHSNCDPWWRHKRHQTHISSFAFSQKHQSSNMKIRVRQFMKHPNRFFASYLEKRFFNKNRADKTNTVLSKQTFIEQVAFYTQALELKVKKDTWLSSNNFEPNKEILNNYVRLAFLKTAKLPLIVATIAHESGVQKRLLLVKQKSILISKTARYRPSLIFDSVKYQKVTKKRTHKGKGKTPTKDTKKYTKTNVKLLTKSSYFLSMVQKGVVYRPGEAVAKTFGQTDFRNLNPICLSGMTSLTKNKQLGVNCHKVSPFNLSPSFYGSKLKPFQFYMYYFYFFPIAWRSLRYTSSYHVAHIYVSQQFNESGSTLTYQSKHIHIRKIDRFNNALVKLNPLNSIDQFSIVNKSVQNKNFELITVTSPVDGLVLQCVDAQKQSKQAPMYEYDMRRFQDQQNPICRIAYLTDRDITTYPFSLPVQKLGSFFTHGEMIINSSLLNQSGQIIYLTKKKCVFRKAQCFYLAAGSDCTLNSGDFVSFGTPLVNVAYSQIEADDIIQGIPKIDQLFEARTRFGFFNLKQLLSKQYRFLRKQGQHTKKEAILEAIDFIQKKIVDGVQTVYQSQGVTISDKHVEIIVKQMTSKVCVSTSLDSGLLKGDVVPLKRIELLGLYDENKIFECEPILLGITQAALQAEGFLSAASFQETVRVLSQAAVVRTTDHLKHLKENIIIGHLLPTGTGLISERIDDFLKSDIKPNN